MVDIFEDTAATPDFLDLGPTDPHGKPPVYTPEALHYRTHVMLQAAMHGREVPPEQMHTMLRDYESMIANGGAPAAEALVAQSRAESKRAVAEELLKTQALEQRTPENIELVQDTIAFIQGLRAEENATEKEFSEALTNGAVSDPAFAAAVEEAEDWGTTVERLRDMLAKHAILERVIAEQQSKREGQSLVADGIDFLGALVPYPTEQTAASVMGVETGTLNLGGALVAAQHLMFSPAMTVEDFEARMPVLVERLENGLLWTNRTEVLHTLEQLRSASQAGVLGHNLLRGLEFGTLPFIAVAKGLGRSVISASRLVGNRRTAVNTVQGTVQAGSSTYAAVNPEGLKEALDAMMPTAMRPTEDLVAGPGLAGEVTTALERNQRVVQEILGSATPSRLSEDDWARAVEKAREKVAREFEGPTITDFDVISDPVSKVRTLRTTLGHPGTGEGLATREAAEALGRRMGLDEFTPVETDGLWFVRVDRAVTEEGIATGFDLNTVKAGTLMGVPVAKYLSGADVLLPESIQAATHLAVDARSRLFELTNQLGKNLAGFNKDAKRGLTAAIKESEARQNWMELPELRQFYRDKLGRDATAKEIVGYYTMKDINDADYFIRNSAEYAKHARAGKKTVELADESIHLEPQNARVQEGVEAPEQKYWLQMNGHDAAQQWLPGEMTAERMQGLLDDGYRIVRLDNAFLRQGHPIEWVVARADNLTVRELSVHQLPYVGGGHRMYEGQYFIKQARIADTADGRRVVLNPYTHHVFTSPAEAKAYVAQLERARLAYVAARDGLTTPEAATRTIEEAGIGVRSYDDFHRLVQEERLSADTQFEALFDRELPAAMKSEPNAYLAANPDLDGVSGWYATTGRMYYGRKGERLRDPQGDLAPILDPFETAHRAMANAVITRAFGDYRTRVVDDWMASFGQYVVAPREAVTPLQRFMQGTVHAPTPEMQAKADKVRATIMRMLNTPTKDALYIRDGIRRLAEWTDQSAAPGAKRLARGLLDHQSSNPVSAAKAFAFNMYLGLFDIGQLLIQPMTIAAAISVSPLRGTQAFAAMPWLRMTMRNTSENWLGWAAKAQAATGTGLSPDDFKQLVRDFRASGKGEISGELAMLDSFSNPHAGNLGARAGKGFLAWGRVPYYEAERMNRMTAYTMAWREWKAIDASQELTQEGVEFIAKRANDYSLSMTNASTSWWQKGVLSVPTQFMSYQARMFEALLPEVLGGSAAFTTQQKLRLAFGQLLLYGGLGLPGTTGALTWSAQQIEDALGVEVTPDVFRAITGGAIDSIIWHSTGGEVHSDWASRAGFWGQGGGIIADMFNEDRSFIEVVGGPPLQVLSTTHKVLSDFARLAKSEIATDGTMDEAALNALANMASSWGRYTRARYIWDYGAYLDRRGNVVGAGRLTKMEAVAAALGVPLREVTDTYRMRDETAEQAQEERDLAEAMVRNRNIALMDPEKTEQVISLNRALFSHLDPLKRERILALAARRVPRDRYIDSFVQAMEKETAKSSHARFQRGYLNSREALIEENE